MTVVSFKLGRTLWVLPRVELVFREHLYCLGRWGNSRRFGSTADVAFYTLVLFLRPAIPRKCELVMSRKYSVLSRVFVVLISLVCVWGGGVVLRCK